MEKAAHEKFGTKLLTTSSADFHYSDIREKLKTLLEKVDVPSKRKQMLNYTIWFFLRIASRKKLLYALS